MLLDFCEEVKNVDFGFVDFFLAELVGDAAAGDVLFEVGQVQFVVGFAASVVALLERDLSQIAINLLNLIEIGNGNRLIKQVECPLID